ncbi:hypothetical protein ES705_09494 [subsurface metagenome]
MKGLEQLIKMQEIDQLIKEGFSLIPLQRNSKIPIERFKWKQFQYKRASIKEVFDWYIKFGGINTGVVTGKISKLVVIDVDDKRQLQELLKIIPNLFDTCYVKTNRGYHFYFFTVNEISSIDSLFGLGIELKAKGRYVVSPGSLVDGWEYKYSKSLTNILPLPKIIIEDVKTVIPGNIEVKKDNRLPVYRGQASCIGQIAREDIPEDTQRHTALLILFNKMIEAGNSKEYSRYFINKKNSQLTVPLPKKDINFDKADIYHYSCSRINRELDFVNCSNCRVRGGLHVQSLLMNNVHKIGGLTNSERGILALLDSYYKGEEIPSINEIQKKTGMNFYTVRDALTGLKEEGII